MGAYETNNGFTCPEKAPTDEFGQFDPHPKYSDSDDCAKFYICLNGISPASRAASSGLSTTSSPSSATPPRTSQSAKTTTHSWRTGTRPRRGGSRESLLLRHQSDPESRPQRIFFREKEIILLRCPLSRERRRKFGKNELISPPCNQSCQFIN